MDKYEILGSRVGKFKQGEIVSEDQIKDAKGDLDFWKKVGQVALVKDAELTKPELDKRLNRAEKAQAEADAARLAAEADAETAARELAAKKG